MFKEPEIPADLLQGRDDCIRRNINNRILGHPRPLDDMIWACLAQGTAGAIRHADVVTGRGTITKYALYFLWGSRILKVQRPD